ncbi:Delayed-early response protein/equilibrative nucleoside transporter [Macrophomina phaseolina MS6]|uniref:Delayed-early response protein/equilibrative nucleoside transporter n=1 Tax=Macrophomina phaseolina (strain MS6) TaxID=1126212 RepID=K2QMJ4_MACPH|nr:Delayed-early response protein/equilibrative nucleoside transporter [Macrophomina phaseolina MS6]
MDRVRQLFQQDQPYEPLDGGSETPEGARIEQEEDKETFSWLDYSIFLLLGVAMLWAWNMFLAAGPYFQSRFRSDENILHTFQSAQLSVSTIVNLGSMLILAKLQASASYPKRIMAALLISIVTFTLLAISTRHFLDVSAKGYFGFMIIMVGAASFGTSLCQNGVFAYVSGFGREEYTQAIMTGQGVAGVLPAIAQIVSVLSTPTEHLDDEEAADQGSKSAFAYFMTATAISALTLVAFVYIHSKRNSADVKHITDSIGDLRNTSSGPVREPVPLLTLLRKLFWLSAAVFLTFAITMVFPVFTQEIKSVHPIDSAPRLLQPASFIPLAFLFWNIGDLIGRILPAFPNLSLTSKPRLVFALSVSRVVFIPLYLLCNVGGRGSKVDSDAFYLIVQLLFGFTNGFLGSTCMMGAVEWVDVEEREAAGGFMGLCLVAGLTAGSLASFVVAGALL